jgi:hypothetical protein
MSKVLWKSLLVSPAVLGATLLVSAGAMATETAASSKAIAPQTTEAQITGSQPVAIAPSSVAPAAEATNSVQEQQAPTTASVETSAKVDVTSSTQTVADLEAGSKVGVAASPEALPAGESSKLWSVPAAAPKVAQTAPATVPSASGSDDSNVLQQINRYTREGNSNSIDQVTNVSQFSDVRPTDWAYQALRDLVERYGCIAGYPDSTFRGNRAMTRYEFAAGLNACLRQIEKLIAGQGSEVTRADLDKLNQLINQFRAELTTLGTRVDRLEGRVAFLEGHQFSTTTKLVGEAILAVTDEFGKGNDTNTIFGDRVRLDLQTSFTGQDKLHTRLAAGNLNAFNFGAVSNTNGTFEGQQTFNITSNNNNIILDWLAYEFPFGSSKVYIAATGGLHADYTPTLNPYFDNGDGGNGALSTFAQYSPIYRIGGGAGAGIRLGVGRAPILGPTSLTVGYLAGNASNPGQDFGLFNGNYSALAQLNFTVSDRIGLAATYVHGYHNTGDNIFDIGGAGGGSRGSAGVVGSRAGNNPFGDRTLGTGTRFAQLDNRPMVSNSYGIEAALRLSDRFSLSGFVGKSDVRILRDGDADIWYGGLGLALPDLGKKGNLLGLFAGVEPYLAGLEVDGRQAGIRTDRSYHLEGFYKYQLTENISITPGIIWLTAPNQNDNNNDAVIGTLRTTFTF